MTREITKAISLAAAVRAVGPQDIWIMLSAITSAIILTFYCTKCEVTKNTYSPEQELELLRQKYIKFMSNVRAYQRTDQTTIGINRNKYYTKNFNQSRQNNAGNAIEFNANERRHLRTNKVTETPFVPSEITSTSEITDSILITRIIKCTRTNPPKFTQKLRSNCVNKFCMCTTTLTTKLTKTTEGKTSTISPVTSSIQRSTNTIFQLTLSTKDAIEYCTCGKKKTTDSYKVTTIRPSSTYAPTILTSLKTTENRTVTTNKENESTPIQQTIRSSKCNIIKSTTPSDNLTTANDDTATSETTSTTNSTKSTQTSYINNSTHTSASATGIQPISTDASMASNKATTPMISNENTITKKDQHFNAGSVVFNFNLNFFFGKNNFSDINYATRSTINPNDSISHHHKLIYTEFNDDLLTSISLDNRNHKDFTKKQDETTYWQLSTSMPENVANTVDYYSTISIKSSASNNETNTVNNQIHKASDALHSTIQSSTGMIKNNNISTPDKSTVPVPKSPVTENVTSSIKAIEAVTMSSQSVTRQFKTSEFIRDTEIISTERKNTTRIISNIIMHNQEIPTTRKSKDRMMADNETVKTVKNTMLKYSEKTDTHTSARSAKTKTTISMPISHETNVYDKDTTTQLKPLLTLSTTTTGSHKTSAHKEAMTTTVIPIVSVMTQFKLGTPYTHTPKVEESTSTRNIKNNDQTSRHIDPITTTTKSIISKITQQKIAPSDKNITTQLASTINANTTSIVGYAINPQTSTKPAKDFSTVIQTTQHFIKKSERDISSTKITIPASTRRTVSDTKRPLTTAKLIATLSRFAQATQYKTTTSDRATRSQLKTNINPSTTSIISNAISPQTSTSLTELLFNVSNTTQYKRKPDKNMTTYDPTTIVSITKSDARSPKTTKKSTAKLSTMSQKTEYKTTTFIKDTISQSTPTFSVSTRTRDSTNSELSTKSTATLSTDSNTTQYKSTTSNSGTKSQLKKTSPANTTNTMSDEICNNTSTVSTWRLYTVSKTIKYNTATNTRYTTATVKTTIIPNIPNTEINEVSPQTNTKPIAILSTISQTTQNKTTMFDRDTAHRNATTKQIGKLKTIIPQDITSKAIYATSTKKRSKSISNFSTVSQTTRYKTTSTTKTHNNTTIPSTTTNIVSDKTRPPTSTKPTFIQTTQYKTNTSHRDTTANFTVIASTTSIVNDVTNIHTDIESTTTLSGISQRSQYEITTSHWDTTARMKTIIPPSTTTSRETVISPQTSTKPTGTLSIFNLAMQYKTAMSKNDVAALMKTHILPRSTITPQSKSTLTAKATKTVSNATRSQTIPKQIVALTTASETTEYKTATSNMDITKQLNTINRPRTTNTVSPNTRIVPIRTQYETTTSDWDKTAQDKNNSVQRQ